MRSGLRLQLLALLGALMVLAFVPLFFATSAYTQLAFENLHRRSALELATSVTTHVNEARPRLDSDSLLALLSAQAEGGAVEALFVYDRSGRVVARVGRPELIDLLGARPPGRPGQLKELHHDGQRFLSLFAPSSLGGVAALARLDHPESESRPLISLMGLYMGVIGLLVLVVAYFALTRWMVRPILELERSAERVAGGGRNMKALEQGPAELVRLSRSLVTMTHKLLLEEDSLRRKIDEVEATTEKLRAAQESLVRSERLATVGRLSAGLAHEIGNPISALMGFEDLLLEGGLSEEEQRDFLERMRKETTRIHRVLGDLLAYARPAQPSLGETAIPGSVEAAVSDVLALVKPQKALSGVELTAQVSPGLPLVRLSHEELTQILLNLVMNAIDACERSGRIQIHSVLGTTDSAQPGFDPAWAPLGVVELSVEDDGPGISPAVLDTLFEPFVSTKEVGKGTGLGLAVTRGLVEAAGGSIRVDTSHVNGARFVLLLPAAPATSSSTVTA